MSRTRNSRVTRLDYDTRESQILSVARDMFAEKGYDGTSVRDIANVIRIQTASIYYYFPSKEDLFVEVMGRGISKISDAVRQAVQKKGNAWSRLEAAAVAHCEAMFEGSGFRVLISPKPPASLNAASVEKLMEQRRTYERMLSTVIESLDLPPQIDRKIFLFTYLAAINGTALWFRKDGPLSAAEVAQRTVTILRCQAAHPPGRKCK